MAKQKLSSKRGQKNIQLSADKQEQALKEMKSTKGKFYGRVTVDLPHEIYNAMKVHLNDDGRTMKGYLKKLISDDLKGKGYM